MIDIYSLSPRHRALHLLRNRSTFSHEDLVGAMPEDSSQADQEAVLESVGAVRLNSQLYTTERVLHAERSVLESAIGRQDETAHQVDSDVVDRVIQDKADAGTPMREEQENAVRHMTGKGGISVVEGAAGVGKSFSLGAAREAYEAQGMNTIGISPAGSAAQELEASSGIPSMTSHRFLNQIENGNAAVGPDHVIVFDEAGTADSMMLARVTDVAHESGAKLVLVGDSKQLESIASGNLLAEVGDRIGRAEMTDIARQKDPEKAAISRSFYQGKGDEAMAKAESLGMVSTHENDAEMNEQIAERYLELSQDGSAVVLANTNRDVEALNEAVTEKLIEEGRLDPSTAKEFALADRNGKPVDRTLYEGHQVMFRSNNQELGVANGTTGQVTGFENGNIQIEIETPAGDMETVEVDPAEYRGIEPAYAVTTFKSQGMTYDHALYKADRMTDARLAYVASTRAKDGTEIFMDENDKEVIIQRSAQFSAKGTTLSGMGEQDWEDLASGAKASEAAVDRSGQNDLNAAKNLADKQLLGSAVADLVDAKQYQDLVQADREKDLDRVAERTDTPAQEEPEQSRTEEQEAAPEASRDSGNADQAMDGRLREMMIARERNLDKAGGVVTARGMERNEYLQSLKDEFGRPSDRQSIYKPNAKDFEGDPDKARRLQDYHDYVQQGRDRGIAQMTNGQDRLDRLTNAQNLNEELNGRLDAENRVATYDRMIQKRANELGMNQDELKDAEHEARKEYEQTGSMHNEHTLSPMERAQNGISLDDAKLQEDRIQLERLTAEGRENTQEYQDTLESLEEKRERMGLEPSAERVAEEEKELDQEQDQEQELEQEHQEAQELEEELDQQEELDDEKQREDEQAELDQNAEQERKLNDLYEQMTQSEQQEVKVEPTTHAAMFDSQKGLGFGQNMVDFYKERDDFIEQTQDMSSEEAREMLEPDPNPELTETLEQDLEQEPDLTEEIEQAEAQVMDQELEEELEVPRETELTEEAEYEAEETMNLELATELVDEQQASEELEAEAVSAGEADANEEIESERLNQEYEQVKDSKEAQEFEQQGGLNSFEMDEMDDLLADIQTSREEREAEQEMELSGNHTEELENEEDKYLNR